jgi:superfamily I DNA/RNA helicase/mRNA-degrading endonuclease RelE of RelBE toxin-antitoxin system
MNFLIADTFSDSLARLTVEEQKAIKITVYDLQANPANPGLSFHKLDKAKDKNFWSVRVSSDIRIIAHRSESSLLLCYVDHHDKAYDWAGRRKLETHPKTGAAQLVEIRESVQEIIVPVYIQANHLPMRKSAVRLLFSKQSDDELLSYGVPSEWLSDVKLVTEESLLTLIEHLPGEAAEALLELATGGKPRVAQPTEIANPFDHPDAKRRFRIMKNVEELERALDFPWEKWTVFLHPEQRQWVERDYSGPARVSGSAGTGKTVVALHRAAVLVRANSEARVLLTTFSNPLANALHSKLKWLLNNEPRLAERIDVYSLEAIGLRLYKSRIGAVSIASSDLIRDLINDASKAVSGHRFSVYFLFTEWEHVVDAWQLGGWEAYRDVTRLGRKTRLPESQRKVLWAIFERVRAELKIRDLITLSEMFSALAVKITESEKVIFDYVIVDEAQDVGVPHLKFLAALGGDRQDALFFAGDLGQRIFQQPFSWKSLGVDVRGRSRTLRVNYRTSHQIRSQADRLLSSTVADADGIKEDRSDTISIFNGPPPSIYTHETEREEIDCVAAWLCDRVKVGFLPHEFGVFVRSPGQLERATNAVAAAGLLFKVLDDEVDTESGYVSVGTMHLAKGLEFRAVVVMACDDEVIPLQERIETVSDDADLQEVYDTERHLLYVACTRARDDLLITSTSPASEFLDDLKTNTLTRRITEFG